MKLRTPFMLVILSAALALVGCSGDDNTTAPPLDSGTADTTMAQPDSGGMDARPDTSDATSVVDSAPDVDAAPPVDSGTDGDAASSDAPSSDAPSSDAPSEGGADALPPFTLQNSPAVVQSSVQPDQLLLTASGETLALLGYNFPAVNPTDPVFADGWEVRFEHFIATFDKVSIWTGTETSTVDQSQVGALVAELDGPWAVDLSVNHAGWPYIDGKEPGERAVAFAVLPNQNKAGNAPFPTTGRLAVGFSEVEATPNALNVNLTPEAVSLYGDMVQRGCVVLYIGQATWRGDQMPGSRCNAATDVNGGDGGVMGGTGQEPEFKNIPTVVNFEFCFKPRAPLAAGAVETSFINCDNQDNDPAAAVNMEPHQRGIAFKSNTYSIGEVTFHTDHPFWESTKHDTPAHFDQFAAQVSGSDGGIPTVHLEDMKGVDYTGFKDKQGNPVPWRICDPNYNNPNGGSRVGQMSFDPTPAGVSHCMNNDPATGFCDYYDFSKYDQSTQGHWNGADGLCAVKRAYASPK